MNETNGKKHFISTGAVGYNVDLQKVSYPMNNLIVDQNYNQRTQIQEASFIIQENLLPDPIS